MAQPRNTRQASPLQGPPARSPAEGGTATAVNVAAGTRAGRVRRRSAVKAAGCTRQTRCIDRLDEQGFGERKPAMRPRLSARGDGQRRFTACAIHHGQGPVATTNRIPEASSHRSPGPFSPSIAAPTQPWRCHDRTRVAGPTEPGHLAAIRPRTGSSRRALSVCRSKVGCWLESRTVVRSSALRERALPAPAEVPRHRAVSPFQLRQRPIGAVPWASDRPWL